MAEFETEAVEMRAQLAALAGVVATGFVVAGVATLAVVGAGDTRRVEPLPARAGPALGAARSWGYQLQKLDASALGDAFDVLVVDYARDGTEATAYSAIDVGRLRHRANGSPRIVLSYLSIGEAESYRFYWNADWFVRPPSWLGGENTAWRRNFTVRFWDERWQRLLFDPNPTLGGWLRDRLGLGVKPYLDRIIEAGFDGVYLDRVDAYETARAERPTARADMIGFVGALSSFAKARRPGFLVVPQNGEDLLSDGRYVAAIDGAGKEDLLYGEGGDGVVNDPRSTRVSVGLLNRAKAAGRPVFVIEYLADQVAQAKAKEDFATLGFIGMFATRSLDQLPAGASTMGVPNEAR
jgi:cysteinyl-tRNA synthetase, unknown class